MLTQKVREIAVELREFTSDDLAERVPAYTWEDKRKIRSAIQRLTKTGEVSRMRKGLYRYKGKKKSLSIKEKIWRAVRIKEYFTRRDLVKLSGASPAYVRNYLIFLKSKGFIEHISGRGHKEALYRLTEPMKAPLEHPKI